MGVLCATTSDELHHAVQEALAACAHLPHRLLSEVLVEREVDEQLHARVEEQKGQANEVDQVQRLACQAQVFGNRVDHVGCGAHDLEKRGGDQHAGDIVARPLLQIGRRLSSSSSCFDRNGSCTTTTTTTTTTWSHHICCGRVFWIFLIEF
jgi:hypothetical protein